MKNKTVILFDMDGTLTPARKSVPVFLINHLKTLSDYATIGIVTGSGLEYLLQQCKRLWDGTNACNPKDFILMPCNGTKLYSWDSKWKLQESSDMRKNLSDSHFDLLMKILIGAQFTHISSDPDHALTGHFIQYRGSLINWCPVGRNANDEQRKKFVDYDKNTDMRFRLMTGVQAMVDKALGPSKVKFALGGNTSIDVYPVGWDKTYALKHFPDSQCWFVGDRCEPSGNDYQIYELLSREGRGFKTTGPEETAKIIEEIIRCLNPTQ